MEAGRGGTAGTRSAPANPGNVRAQCLLRVQRGGHLKDDAVWLMPAASAGAAASALDAAWLRVPASALTRHDLQM
jgi:hypothetical protein